MPGDGRITGFGGGVAAGGGLDHTVAGKASKEAHAERGNDCKRKSSFGKETEGHSKHLAARVEGGP